jgi:hypothetical protein
MSVQGLNLRIGNRYSFGVKGFIGRLYLVGGKKKITVNSNQMELGLCCR